MWDMKQAHITGPWLAVCEILVKVLRWSSLHFYLSLHRLMFTLTYTSTQHLELSSKLPSENTSGKMRCGNCNFEIQDDTLRFGRVPRCQQQFRWLRGKSGGYSVDQLKRSLHCLLFHCEIDVKQQNSSYRFFLAHSIQKPFWPDSSLRPKPYWPDLCFI
jgi:hypothetical protein